MKIVLDSSKLFTIGGDYISILLNQRLCSILPAWSLTIFGERVMVSGIDPIGQAFFNEIAK